MDKQKWSTYMGRGVVGTYNKHLVNILDPDPETIFLEDIVQGLVHTCRWNGQVKHFYSVAQHSLHVCDLVAPELRLQALFHDASEAFMNDLSSPVKQLLPQYKLLENKLMKAIATRFGFEWPMHHMVKIADADALEIEHLNLRMGNDWACQKEDPKIVYMKFMIKARQVMDFRVWNKVTKGGSNG